MRRLAHLALALSTLALAGAAGAQQLVTIDFAEFASPTTTEYPATVGAPLYSKGLDFYETQFWNGNNSRNVLGTWGNAPADPGSVNRPTNIGGATAMFATNTTGLEIDIYSAGSDFVAGTFGDPFTLHSIDVAHLYSDAFSPFALGTINLTFRGTGPGTGGGTISQAFSIPVPAPVGGVRTPLLSTLTFDSRWQGLVNVWWFQGTGSGTSHQFTNVVATVVLPAAVVPEPGTYALLLTGLVGLGVATRRRPAAVA